MPKKILYEITVIKWSEFNKEGLHPNKRLWTRVENDFLESGEMSALNAYSKLIYLAIWLVAGAMNKPKIRIGLDQIKIKTSLSSTQIRTHLQSIVELKLLQVVEITQSDTLSTYVPTNPQTNKRTHLLTDEEKKELAKFDAQPPKETKMTPPDAYCPRTKTWHVVDDNNRPIVTTTSIKNGVPIVKEEPRVVKDSEWGDPEEARKIIQNLKQKKGVELAPLRAAPPIAIQEAIEEEQKKIEAERGAGEGEASLDEVAI